MLTPIDFGRILNRAVQVGRSSWQAWWRASSESLGAKHGMVRWQVGEATLSLIWSVRVDVFQIWSGDGGRAWFIEIYKTKANQISHSLFS